MTNGEMRKLLEAFPEDAPFFVAWDDCLWGDDDLKVFEMEGAVILDADGGSFLSSHDPALAVRRSLAATPGDGQG